MDEQHGDGSMAPEGDASPASIEALAASLKAMEGMMGELSRTLGSLRPSGVAYAPQAESAPPRTREAEALPPRSDVALRPSGRRSILRSSVARDGELLLPSACCDACAAREARQLVFALGKLGYDFGTEARMDSIQSQMSTIAASDRNAFPTGVASASNPLDLVKFLQTKQGGPASPAITWTLNLNESAIYAIQPEGYYVKDTYKFLVETLEEQTRSALTAAAAAPPPDGTGKGKGKTPPPPPPVTPAIERLSLPGVISGETELMNGLVVPSVQPALAGMFTWRTEDLVKALENYTPPAPPPKPEIGDLPFDPRQGLATFLNRIYEELRNVGLAPQDRALNFAATNAYQASNIFVKLRGRNIHIEKFEVVRSPVMRPDSDCWDVKMIFYNPAGPTTSPREVYFFTVDVSDVVPVAIGAPRHWTMY